MIGKDTIRRAGHGAALATAVGLLGAGEPASAGVITFFDDRTAWETAALAAGLTISTEDFSTQPAGFPSFSVGGVDFTSDGPYDAVNQRAGYAGGGGHTMKIDFTGVSNPTVALFGFGLFTNVLGVVRATDLDGAFVNNGAGTNSFIGLLGTVPFDPANLLAPNNPNDDGATEYGTSGSGAAVWVDDLSVATGPAPPRGPGAAPEPGTLTLLGAGLAGLSLLRRRRLF